MNLACDRLSVEDVSANARLDHVVVSRAHALRPLQCHDRIADGDFFDATIRPVAKKNRRAGGYAKFLPVVAKVVVRPVEMGEVDLVAAGERPAFLHHVPLRARVDDRIHLFGALDDVGEVLDVLSEDDVPAALLPLRFDEPLVAKRDLLDAGHHQKVRFSAALGPAVAKLQRRARKRDRLPRLGLPDDLFSVDRPHLIERNRSPPLGGPCPPAHP